PELVEVLGLEARHVAVPGAVLGLGSLPRHYLSISWPQSARRQWRPCTCSPLISFTVVPMRVSRLQTGQTTMTFETGIGAALSITPPGVSCAPRIRLAFLIGRGFVCRLTTFRFSTTTGRSRG